MIVVHVNKPLSEHRSTVFKTVELDKDGRLPGPVRHFLLHGDPRTVRVRTVVLLRDGGAPGTSRLRFTVNDRRMFEMPLDVLVCGIEVQCRGEGWRPPEDGDDFLIADDDDVMVELLDPPPGLGTVVIRFELEEVNPIS